MKNIELQERRYSYMIKITLFLILISISSPILLAGVLGLKQIKVVSMIKTAYSLWRKGMTVPAALSAATGGWSWAINLLLQFGIAYLASKAFTGSWVVSY
ncbi:MAG: hypothetical protein ACK5LM_03630 [Lactovum sp.]